MTQDREPADESRRENWRLLAGMLVIAGLSFLSWGIPVIFRSL